MSFGYKNNSTDVILRSNRNLKYASGGLMYGFNNNIIYSYEITQCLVQISLQANIFALTMLTYKTVIPFKHFLGAFQEDWPRILHEAYVYDRLVNIFYGIYSVFNPYVPENTFSFIGNIYLRKMLESVSFIWNTNDTQPFSIELNLVFVRDIFILCGEILNCYPSLQEGLNISGYTYRYSNFISEAVLCGLYNNREQAKFKGKKGNGETTQLYQIYPRNTDSCDKYLLPASNPILNSNLSISGDRWRFIKPASDSTVGALRYDESTYISRAIGCRSNELKIEGNNIYMSVPRDEVYDIHVREEVFAITGVKSELIPDTAERINQYLGINNNYPTAKRSNVKFDRDDSQKEEAKANSPR